MDDKLAFDYMTKIKNIKQWEIIELMNTYDFCKPVGVGLLNVEYNEWKVLCLLGTSQQGRSCSVLIKAYKNEIQNKCYKKPKI